MTETTTSLGLAIVTGGAGDIGQAVARRLAATHAGVVVVDRDQAGAAAAAAGIGPRARGAACDVTDPAALAALAAGLEGPVSTLVNNAGAAMAASLGATTPTSWGADRALNLDAAWFCFEAFRPALIAARGSVVNVASINGLGVFGHPAYSAAKAGMIHLTRLIAVEYGRRGIRANAVAPGTVATRAWESRRAANPWVMQEAAAHYPLGRVAYPDDIAAAVAFLAGPDAAAITGVCLPVDCGLTAGTPALARTFSQSPDYESEAPA
ncbi:MAG TPA: SDR family oxidoreductase [Amaricoccus sp.]|uniref:SDR family oxidoreductase n=1 Tax=Amaricoccus sp. TaxID=1872485 RepID=UPI002C25ADCB|nr:SDR family oxidoreductase [Amaricoccus sp.]HPG22102.1 SDR family oxidoreductase [Amaricoccus sp.]HRW14368.1 SDR family oxidoreductase [Amaricoccus sp.]